LLKISTNSYCIVTEKPKRHMLAVTMKQDLIERCRAAAAERDLPVTAWVREQIVTALDGAASS
jgi:hypothetical protein